MITLIILTIIFLRIYKDYKKCNHKNNNNIFPQSFKNNNDSNFIDIDNNKDNNKIKYNTCNDLCKTRNLAKKENKCNEEIQSGIGFIARSQQRTLASVSASFFRQWYTRTPTLEKTLPKEVTTEFGLELV